MKVLCVQCIRLNEVPDDVESSEGEGKLRFPCPSCGFVTVVTRTRPKGAAREAEPFPAGGAPRSRTLEEELFDGVPREAGDWMVRRLDGSESGPHDWETLTAMIHSGSVGKIDEVRRRDERYVPAAFHEKTAELFNALDTPGPRPARKS